MNCFSLCSLICKILCLPFVRIECLYRNYEMKIKLSSLEHCIVKLIYFMGQTHYSTQLQEDEWVGVKEKGRDVINPKMDGRRRWGWGVLKRDGIQEFGTFPRTVHLTIDL